VRFPRRLFLQDLSTAALAVAASPGSGHKIATASEHRPAEYFLRVREARFRSTQETPKP
jgi:hypothetical protein